MSQQVYEVKVKVRNHNERYDTRVYHYRAKDADKACQRARKHGQPISARKVNRDALFGDIERLRLDVQIPPFSPAIAMAEMLWRKNNGKRLKNKKNGGKQK